MNERKGSVLYISIGRGTGLRKRNSPTEAEAEAETESRVTARGCEVAACRIRRMTGRREAMAEKHRETGEAEKP